VLKSRMLALRATRSDWTVQMRKQSIKRMALQGWGALGHGGVRKKAASVVEGSGSAQGALAKTVGDDASAVGAHCGGMFTKAVGDASAVGEHRGGARGALAKTGGALSAVGEGEVQRGVEEDAHSDQTECGSKHADELPVVTAPLRFYRPRFYRLCVPKPVCVGIRLSNSRVVGVLGMCTRYVRMVLASGSL